MKFVNLMLIVLLSGCAAVREDSPFQTSSTNLTEAEVRSLPVGTTFEAVEKRLRYFARSEIAIPLIAFEIEGKKGYECMMLFSDGGGPLRYAWSASEHSSTAEDAIVLWPEKYAGRKLSEVLHLFEKKEANQSSTAQRP